MDATTTFIALLARLADRARGWHPALLGAFVIAVLVTLVAAFGVGALVADLLAQDPETVLAAPFRWRQR